MKDKIKNIVILLTLLCVLLVSGAIAYLTDMQFISNIFTVGIFPDSAANALNELFNSFSTTIEII